MLTSKLTKAIGGNSDLLTSQSFVYQGSISESEHVMLLIVLSASGEDVFTKVRNLGILAEQLFFNADTQEIEQPPAQVVNHEELYSKPEQPITEQEPVKTENLSLTDKIHFLMDFLQEQMKSFDQRNMLIAVLKEEVLYMLSSGEDKVLLHREEKTTQLIDSGEMQLISGSLQPGDKVLFLSPRMEIFGLQQPPNPQWDEYFIQRLLLSDQAVIEEEIATYLQQLEIPEPIAAILLTTQSQQPVEEHERQYNMPQEINDSPSQPKAINIPPTQLRSSKVPLSSLIKIPTIPYKVRRSIFKAIFPLSFKKIGIISVLLFALLISGGVSLVQFQQKQQLQRSLTNALAQTKQNLDQADMLKETNLEQSKQFLSTAKQSLSKATELDPKNTEVLALNTRLEQSQRTILKTAEITNWQTFLSLDLIRPGFSTKRMSYSLGKILLLDETQKSLTLVDIESKSNQLLAGQTQLGEAEYASLNGDFAFVFSQDKGLLRVETTKRQLTTVATLDSEWKNIVDLFGFSSNVYLLDAGQNQIWKYVPTASGYSEKQIYLSDNQGLDFTSAKQLFIDFSVWVIKENAALYRFTSGNKDFFSIGGLDEPIESIERIFAPEEEDKVFLLDGKNKRIVVTKKNGEYLSQYVSDLFTTATDLFYDEQSKTLFLLEGGKILQTTLP